MFVKHMPVEDINYNRFVKFTRQGNIFEIMSYEHKSEGNSIIKIDKDHYYDLKSPIFNGYGEVMDPALLDRLADHKGSLTVPLYTSSAGYVYEMKNYIKNSSRAQSPNEIRKTFKRLRAIINTNVVDVRKCKFITLTYAENMTDPEQLKKDLVAFNKRFKRYIYDLTDDAGNKKGLDYEYISVCEPQGRGAWHAHIIFIFNKQIQFLKNSDVMRIWKGGDGKTKRGFTTTKKIDNVDNVGAYLTAYLADMELPDKETISFDQMQFNNQRPNVKEVNAASYDENGKFKGFHKKKIIKGGRLNLYPVGFHIYRCSKGVKRPSSEYTTYGEAIREIGADAALTYTHTVQISDGENYTNTLTYEVYNRKRKVERKDARTSTSKILQCAVDYSNDFHYVEKLSKEEELILAKMRYNTSEILLKLEEYEKKYSQKTNYS